MRSSSAAAVVAAAATDRPMILRRVSGEEETKGSSRAEYRLLYSWGETALADDPTFFRPILETATFQRALENLGACTIDLAHTASGYTLRVLVALPAENTDLPETDLPEEVIA